MAALAGPLHEALTHARRHRRVGGGLRLPRPARPTTASWHCAAAGRYPLESGRVASSDGLDLAPGEFADLVVEEHVARSTALQARLEGRLEYLTGPLARYALNADQLPDLARQAAAGAGLGARVTTRSRASSCVPSSWCSPARKL